MQSHHTHTQYINMVLVLLHERLVAPIQQLNSLLIQSDDFFFVQEGTYYQQRTNPLISDP